MVWRGAGLSATTRCSIPWFGGAILSQEWKEALWDKFATIEPLCALGSSTVARVRRQNCSTAIASIARAVEPGAGHQTEDIGEMAQARHG
jgi:hypothetical protein